MSLSTTTNRTDYIGNGATGTYSYTYRIFEETDLVVIVADLLSVETTLTLTTDYTVTGVGDANGNIVLDDSGQSWMDGSGNLLTGYTLVIKRIRPLTQLTDIRNQGDFFPETHEDAYDHGIMIDQQLQEQIDRAITLSPTTPTTVSAVLAAPLADAPIGWNAAGDALVNNPRFAFKAGVDITAVPDYLGATAGTGVLRVNTTNMTKTDGGDFITLNTIQDIATTSSPTFNGLTLTSLTLTLTVTSISNDGTLAANSAAILPTQQAVKTYVDSAILTQNEFIELTDVPATYAGSALRVVRVNAGETGLEFTAYGLDHAYDAAGSGIGRTITADAGAVEITGNGNRALELVQTTAHNALLIDQNGNQTAVYIDSEATAGPVFWIDTPLMVDSAVIRVSGANSLTTGGMLGLSSASPSATVRSLVFVENTNALSIGTTVMELVQSSTGLVLDATGDVDVTGDVNITGKLTVSGLIDPTGLVLTEQATVPGGAPAAGYGTIWVRNDTPNILLFTDDAGTDFTITTNATGANRALSNLLSVAINTTLVSDTDNTDDLGTAAIGWGSLFLSDAGSAPTTNGQIRYNSANTRFEFFENGGVTFLTAGGGANTALSNLAAVAINTSLISDTDNMDALGSAAIGWSALYLSDAGSAPTTNGEIRYNSANTRFEFYQNGGVDFLSAGGGANTSLSNLSAVAINTTLVSDTDNTDNLGTAAIGWGAFYLSDAGSAPTTNGEIRYNTANTRFEFYQNGGVSFIGAGGADSLDTAYDFGGAGAGRTITVDSGVVQLNSTAGALGITDTGTTTTVLDIVASSLTTGKGIRIYSNSASTSGRVLIEVHNDNSAATGTLGMWIRQDSITDSALAITTGGRGIGITNNGNTESLGITSDSLTSGTVIPILANGLTTGAVVTITVNAITSGKGIYVITTSTSGSVGPLIMAESTATTGSVMAGRFIIATTSSSSRCVDINATGASGDTCALSVGQSSVAGFGIRMDTPGIATGNGLRLINFNSLTTGAVARFHSNSADTSTRNIIEAVNDNTAATNTVCAMLQQNAAVGFINFVGTAGANTTDPISTHNTPGATTDFIQIRLNGTKAWIAVSTNNPSA